MDNIIEKALLYDFYGELLTERQKEVYEDFVLNDLSLGEIAEEREISRQAVYDLVKRCNKLLEGYENKLHLVNKFLETQKKVKEINEYTTIILNNRDNQEEILQSVEKIQYISNNIIKDM